MKMSPSRPFPHSAGGRGGGGGDINQNQLTKGPRSVADSSARSSSSTVSLTLPIPVFRAPYLRAGSAGTTKCCASWRTALLTAQPLRRTWNFYDFCDPPLPFCELVNRLGSVFARPILVLLLKARLWIESFICTIILWL